MMALSDSPSFHLLPRLFVAARLAVGLGVTLDPDQTHYLCHVLRLQVGDLLRIVHPDDGEFLAVLEASHKKHAVVGIKDLLRSPVAVLRRVHLVFSPLKKEAMDFLVEKAVELGVTDLHPVLFDRSIVRNVKEDRLYAQVLAASAQCERLDIPILHPVTGLKAFLAHGVSDSLVLYAAVERVDHPPLSRQKTGDGSVGFVVGPEGGITADEVAFLLNIKSVVPVSLGPRILRAETAALYGLSLLNGV